MFEPEGVLCAGGGTVVVGVEAVRGIFGSFAGAGGEACLPAAGGVAGGGVGVVVVAGGVAGDGVWATMFVTVLRAGACWLSAATAAAAAPIASTPSAANTAPVERHIGGPSAPLAAAPH